KAAVDRGESLNLPSTQERSRNALARKALTRSEGQLVDKAARKNVRPVRTPQRLVKVNVLRNGNGRAFVAQLIAAERHRFREGVAGIHEEASREASLQLRLERIIGITSKILDNSRRSR